MGSKNGQLLRAFMLQVPNIFLPKISVKYDTKTFTILNNMTIRWIIKMGMFLLLFNRWPLSLYIKKKQKEQLYRNYAV